MNLVLADTEEFRKVKRKQNKSSAPAAPGSAAAASETEEKRTLGLVIIRGTNIVSSSVEGPPPSDPASRLGQSAPGGATAALQAGTGISRPAGRGLPVGLGGPAAGVGGPPPPGGFGFPPGGGFLEEHRRRDSQEEVPVDLQQAALLLASALRLLVSVHHRLDFNHHLVSKVARLAKEEDMVHQASAGEGVII